MRCSRKRLPLRRAKDSPLKISVPVRCAPIALALLFACSTAISQDDPKAVPENARAAYGGWDCMPCPVNLS